MLSVNKLGLACAALSSFWLSSAAALSDAGAGGDGLGVQVLGEAESDSPIVGFDLYAASSVKARVEEADLADGNGMAGGGCRELKADVGAAFHYKAKDAAEMSLLLSAGLPYTAFSELQSLLPRLSDGGEPGDGEEHEARGVAKSGVSLHIMNPRLVVQPDLYVGNLRFSGAVSRLKRPCLSAPWNFAAMSLPKNGLAASLPSFSSADSPGAAAVCLRPADGSLPLPVVELALVEGGDVYASVYRQLSFPASRSSVLLLAANAGAFAYGGTELASWFYSRPFYRKRQYLSADAELGFRLEHRLSASFSAGFSENPLSGLEDAFFWRRGQLAVSFWRLGLTASHFVAEHPDMILPGGSRLNLRSRLSLNPSIKSVPLAGAGTFSVALLGMRDVKLENACDREFFTCGLKLVWNVDRIRLSAQYTDSFFADDGEEASSHVRKYSLRLGVGGGGLSSSSAFTLRQDGEKTSLSFSQYLHPGQGIVSSLSVGGGADFCGMEREAVKFHAGATVAFRSGRGSFRGKFLYTATFPGDF